VNELQPLPQGQAGLRGVLQERHAVPGVHLAGHAAHGDAARPGRTVQVDPIKPTLKAPGTKRLTLRCDTLLSTSAYKFNLRRYKLAVDLSLAALLGDDVYNFAELLAHPIVTALPAGAYPRSRFSSI